MTTPAPDEWLVTLEQERDDAFVYLSTIKRVFDAGAAAPTVGGCAQAIAQTLVAELGAEECIACLRSTDGRLEPSGSASQDERFGRAVDATTRGGLLALAHLMGDVAEPRAFVRAADGGYAAVAVEALAGEGCLVLPVGNADDRGGVVLLRWLLTPAVSFARLAAFRLIAAGVGQALAIARERETRGRVIAQLTGELGLTRDALDERDAGLRTGAERIEALTRELVQAHRAKSEFLATLSHELRTPLNGVLGYASLLHDGAVQNLTPEQSAWLEKVLSSGHHLHALIDDLLFFVQTEADRWVVEREPIETRALLDEVLQSLPAQPAEVAFSVEIEAAVGRLLIDPRLGRRILFHLLSNAFKFTPQGSVTLRIEAAERVDAGVRIVVRDTGVGIPAEKLQGIFDAFTQADGSSTRRFEGLGMGLTLVRRCAQLLGGDVGVESAVGAGSTFRVTLPSAAGAPVAAVRGAHTAEPMAIAARGPA